MRVTIFGGTGVVGRALIPRLVTEHDLVAVSRSPQPEEPGIRWIQGDASSAEDVERAVEGAEIVFYLVHSLGSRDFEQQDQVAAQNVADACERAKVAQIVYLGGLGDDTTTASAHLRSRRETGERLAAGSTPVTTLRAAIIIGKGSAAFETIVALVDRLPAMITPSWVSTPTQPIALEDISRYLAGVCGDHATFGMSFDAGGPEVMTYRQMIERIGALRGRRPWIVEVPVLTPRLSSLWLHLVTPVGAAVARPLIEGLKNPTIAREERLRRLLPFELTTFDAAASAAFAS